MAGLLSDILGVIDRSKQAAKANLGLLFNDPKEYMATMEGQAREFNRLQSLAAQGSLNASKGLPVTPEQLAARQYVDRVTNDIAMGFAGTVGSAPRKLPLGDIGEITRFTKPLPKGELYREVSGNSFLDMSSGNYPMGSPISMFAEVPEMALGQGSSKGLMFKVNSEGLRGRPYLEKPGLDTAYLNKAGEFSVTEQPNKILSSMQEVWVSPEAYKGMSKGQGVALNRFLNNLEKNGIKVNKVDKLPGRFAD
jgi:hypothetical protein